MANLENVKDDIRPAVANNSLATELSSALSGMFTIEFFNTQNHNRLKHVVLHCKPTRNIADSLLLDREVLALGLSVRDVQVRTLHVAVEIAQGSNGRLDPAFFIVAHSDPSGDEKLSGWGREMGYKVVPIYRPKAGALPAADFIRRNLAQDLFAYDPFSLTGPVLSDAEFFGRRTTAIDIFRQLKSGRIISIFGVRKLGKTSLINRVVNLSRENGDLNIAMIDCSVDGFYKLDADGALKAVAKAAKMAASRGYSHISEALKRSDKELVPVFDDLWGGKAEKPIAIIFDEIDYITPSSPTRPEWKSEFNKFWREFRVVYQEAQRMGFPLSVMVSGVSSQAFRVESFDGIENSVLHFVPEGYLAPFARQASNQMMKRLFKRCGLIVSNEELDKLAEVCADFPYWMRLAGSYIHHSIDIQGRPRDIESKLFEELLDDFIDAEGVEVSRVALEDLRRKSPEPIELLKRAEQSSAIPLREGNLILRYGLASRTSSGVAVTSEMIKSGLESLGPLEVAVVEKAEVSSEVGFLSLATEEWAEELSVINRRRNIMEKKLREIIHFSLKFASGKGESWVVSVLSSLPERQRAELSSLSGDALLNRIYWKDLLVIVTKNWQSFEKIFGDKRRFSSAMELLNDRPDAHAKSVDAADIALYRRELSWLEEKLA